MEITTTPDVYEPSIDESGNYVDNIPKFDNTRKNNGIRCLCANRDKVFYKRMNFKAHTETKNHQEWLIGLTRSKTNHMVELKKACELIDQQKLIIVQQSQQISQKDQEIAHLYQTISMISSRINPIQTPVQNLLELDE